MAGDLEADARELRVLQRAGEFVDVATGRLVELRAVAREMDLEIELGRPDRTRALTEEVDDVGRAILDIATAIDLLNDVRDPHLAARPRVEDAPESTNEGRGLVGLE